MCGVIDQCSSDVSEEMITLARCITHKIILAVIPYVADIYIVLISEISFTSHADILTKNGEMMLQD